MSYHCRNRKPFDERMTNQSHLSLRKIQKLRCLVEVIRLILMLQPGEWSYCQAI